MKEITRLLFIVIIAFLFGFGIWYLIFWFLSGESDLFKWHWVVKVVYLFIGFSSTNSVVEKIEN